MSAMAPTKWGIASAGLISHDFANALICLSPEDHKIVAVAAREKGKAEEFAKDFDIPKVGPCFCTDNLLTSR
jgi:dihydrodiol dehydrogenase / D-xylose 1-dehydrogenase (NADP)